MSVKKLLAYMRKADEMFNLIEDGDKIAVGISGGKDSTLLLYCMNIYRLLAKKTFNKEFEVIGIHINMNFGEDDDSDLLKFFKDNNLSYYAEDSQIADILNLNLKDGRIQCSLCSKLKKGAVINAAKKLGCNKVAFGHHGDDAVETLFLNMIYGGRISTFDPIMYLESSEITFIRPFALAFESEIKKTVKQLNIPIMKSGCPNDGFTKRQDIKELLHSIYKEYPGSKENFLLSLYNHEKINLYLKPKCR
ncbi:MAG: ATP-binding protein [Erysipelotrichaceae bacterium]|nr:ATP-binding protein [Erysipelotrichaceae bacterium]